MGRHLALDMCSEFRYLDDIRSTNIHRTLLGIAVPTNVFTAGSYSISCHTRHHQSQCLSFQLFSEIVEYGSRSWKFQDGKLYVHTPNSKAPLMSPDCLAYTMSSWNMAERFYGDSRVLSL